MYFGKSTMRPLQQDLAVIPQTVLASNPHADLYVVT